VALGWEALRPMPLPLPPPVPESRAGAPPAQGAGPARPARLARPARPSSPSFAAAAHSCPAVAAFERSVAEGALDTAAGLYGSGSSHAWRKDGEGDEGEGGEGGEGEDSEGGGGEQEQEHRMRAARAAELLSRVDPSGLCGRVRQLQARNAELQQQLDSQKRLVERSVLQASAARRPPDWLERAAAVAEPEPPMRSEAGVPTTDQDPHTDDRSGCCFLPASY
jgi:hypothetical protein